MNVDKHHTSPDQLRQLMIQKWPEAVSVTAGLSEPIFHTGLESLDALFPRRGIPYGQLIELTGADGSGKTTLLFMLLATLTKTETVVYIDLSGSFFPTAAAACGVDVGKVLVVGQDPCDPANHHASTPLSMRYQTETDRNPERNRRVTRTSRAQRTFSCTTGDRFARALRAAELVLSQQVAGNIVIDLTTGGSSSLSRKGDSSPVLLHRLRQQTARSKALVIFLTETAPASPPVIPASTVALRLEVAHSTENEIPLSTTATQRVGPGLVSGRRNGATQGRTLLENNNPHSTITVTVTKSRISKEGARAEVIRYE